MSKGTGMGIEASMSSYYAQRAATYERVYFKPERQAELRLLEAWLPTQLEGRRVLEVACGTGWWTPHGALRAKAWLATDLSPETMAVARRKRLPACVQFAAVDAYTFAELGSQAFDAALAGFWWSHVPLQRLPGWLQRLHARLQPGARVVMLDNRYVQGSNHPISHADADGNTYQTRRLDDGSVHAVLKNFPSREQALSMLGSRAHSPEWTDHGHYWTLCYRLN